MATKKTLLEKLFGVDQAKQVEASFKLKTMSRYFKALDEHNKEFIKTGKIENSQELIDATNEFKLLEINEKRKRRSSVNSKNAAEPRKKDKPTKKELEEFKDTFIYQRDTEFGWKAKAQKKFNISYQTLMIIIK
jgi:hypothetical protein